MNWSDAVSYAMSRAPGGRGAGGYPRISNRDASGLILFARAVATAAAAQGRPVAFDWYAAGLPALGWQSRGDRFDMSPVHQQAEYPVSSQLWLSVQQLARALDEASLPFRMPRDVTGTTATYKELAELAWSKMQHESPADAAASRATKPGAFDPRKRHDAGEVHGRPERDRPRPIVDRPGGGAGAGILLLLLGLAMLSGD